MERYFEKEFSKLRHDLLTMAALALENLSLSVKALVERKDDLCTQVEAADKELDQLEIKIDEECILLLMRRQPVANDLRLVTCAMKICTDLERIGDQAVSIARLARELNKEPQLKEYEDIPRMSGMAHTMIDSAIRAFVSGDAALARSIPPEDKKVDALNKQMIRELYTYMCENRDYISRAMNLMQVSRALERAADHGKNIAEEVVYLYEAIDIRHSSATANKPRINLES